VPCQGAEHLLAQRCRRGTTVVHSLPVGANLPRVRIVLFCFTSSISRLYVLHVKLNPPNFHVILRGMQTFQHLQHCSPPSTCVLPLATNGCCSPELCLEYRPARCLAATACCPDADALRLLMILSALPCSPSSCVNNNMNNSLLSAQNQQPAVQKPVLCRVSTSG
jgi:hypothetical protein